MSNQIDTQTIGDVGIYGRFFDDPSPKGLKKLVADIEEWGVSPREINQADRLVGDTEGDTDRHRAAVELRDAVRAAAGPKALQVADEMRADDG